MAQLDIKKANSVPAGAWASLRASPLRLTLPFAVVGALSFWLPDLTVHIAARANFGPRQVWINTILMPTTFLFAYLVARKFAVRRNFKWLGAVMLLGVWFSGGSFMTLAALASGSGLMVATGVWCLVIIVLSVIPIVTFVLSSYDGSLFPLLAVTLGSLIVCGLRASWMLFAAPTAAGSSCRENTTRRSNAA